MGNFTPAAGNALGLAYPPRTVTDIVARTDEAHVWDAEFGAYPVYNELLGLITQQVSGLGYMQAFTCGAGDAVGDPVRLSGNNTVTKALATNQANARVLGFIAHKGPLGAASVAGATTCYLVHFLYVSGLSGGTAGGKVYLTDTGTFSATPGTFEKIVGVFISTTEALVVADSLNAVGGMNVADLGDVDLAGLSDGDTLTYESSSGNWVPVANATSDEKVKADDTDPTAGHLDSKLDGTTLEVDAASHTARVKDGSITFAKMQDVNEDVLLGCSSASGGQVEEITCKAAGRALLDDDDAAAQRTTMGVDPARTTAAKTTDYDVVAGDKGALFTNEGSSGERKFNLPSAAANLGPFTFYVQNDNGTGSVKVVAAGGDTIRNGAGVSTSGGNISSNVVGSIITLRAINNTEWIATAVIGTWTPA